MSAQPGAGSIFSLRRRNWRGAGPLGPLMGSPAAFVLLVVALATGTANYLAGEADRAATARANATIAGVERLVSEVKDLETGERGFVLVGSEDYLAPYTAALTKIETELASLGSAAQEPVRAGGPSLAGLIAQKRDFAARVITARREQGFEAATELVRTGEGKRLMDAIRVEAATRQDASAQRLATLQAQEHRRGLILFLLSGMAALGAIVLLARLALVRRQESLRMS
ncbi:MAG: CHASE3 domain-containing protein, partial [Hyphomicrobiales bacterium]